MDRSRRLERSDTGTALVNNVAALAIHTAIIPAGMNINWGDHYPAVRRGDRRLMAVIPLGSKAAAQCLFWSILTAPQPRKVQRRWNGDSSVRFPLNSRSARCCVMVSSSSRRLGVSGRTKTT